MLSLLDDEEEGPKETPLAPVALRSPRVSEQTTPSYRVREEDEEYEEEEEAPPPPGSAAARAECAPPQRFPLRRACSPPLPPLTPSRVRRQLLLDDFLEACPTARVLPAPSTGPLRLQLEFVGREERRPNTLLITLPPAFPYSPPLLHLTQPLSHPWTRELPPAARSEAPAAAASLLSGSLREWNVRWGSTLQEVVLEVLEQMAAKKRRGVATRAVAARAGAPAVPAPPSYPFLSPDDQEFLDAPREGGAAPEEEEEEEESWLAGADNVPTAELEEMGYARETVFALLDGAATLAADMLGLSSWPSPPPSPPRHSATALGTPRLGFPIIAAIPSATGEARPLPISRPPIDEREVILMQQRAATPGAGTDGF